MRYTTLGSTGFEVSVVSFGTWTIGGADWGRVDDRDSIKAMRRAYELGVNLFDTAPIYGNGHAETLVGQALADVRDQVFIATKCGPWEDEQGRLRLDLSPDGIRGQVEDSLRRLGTDRIDLLQVHWNDTMWPIDETMRTLSDLVVAGKIRAFGVSNFNPAELEQAVAGGCATLQSPFSLLNIDVERELLPACVRHGLGFLAYEPLGRGLLGGRYTAVTRFEPSDIRSSDPRFRGREFLDNLGRVEALRIAVHMHGMDTATAAIAWVCGQTGVTTAICGARNATQAAANARAGDVLMDPGLTAKLRKIFS
ncbi:MAG TPA: aldo/keto reductase [Myxococcota bacterium]|nr:aldo/keto reductase [Myxococcota bacterium]HQP96139.1 aldo/keto reductase [Myxococcota bacterium]